MNTSTNSKIKIKLIQKTTFNKFKIVRTISNPIYGSYNLTSKDGFKYISKQLSSSYNLQTYRNINSTIFKYSPNKDTSVYLFPLKGQKIINVFNRKGSNKQLDKWRQKYSNIQSCLIQLTKFMINLVQNNQLSEILIDCIRIQDGKIDYCYDSWMENSFTIILKNRYNIEDFYFSNQDLQNIKKIQDKQILINQYKPSKQSLYFRIFLMILHIGTQQSTQRLYQLGLYRLNMKNINMRIDSFMIHYNSKGLGNLLKLVLQNKYKSLDQIKNKLFLQKVQSKRKVLHLVSSNQLIKKSKLYTEQNEKIKNNFSYSSTNSLLNQSTYIQKTVEKYNKSNKSLQNSNYFTCINQNMIKQKNKNNFINYKINTIQQLNLRKIILNIRQIPKYNTKLLKYLGIQEYIPKNIYEQKIVKSLQNIYIKQGWAIKVYQNQSVYFGDIKQQKRYGKGLFIYKSNDLYFGDWENDQINGQGVYIYVSGQFYEGSLKNSSKDGHGIYFYKDGSQYQGTWVQNIKIGLGKIKFPNNISFVGIFKLNKQTQGIFLGPINENGKPLWQQKGILQSYEWQKNNLNQVKINPKNSCQNQFLQNKQIQFIKYSEKTFYQGEVLNGKKQGFGILQDENRVYKGQWKNDKRQGKGTLIVQNQFTIQGQWKDNMFVRFIDQNCNDFI